MRRNLWGMRLSCGNANRYAAGAWVRTRTARRLCVTCERPRGEKSHSFFCVYICAYACASFIYRLWVTFLFMKRELINYPWWVGVPPYEFSFSLCGVAPHSAALFRLNDPHSLVYFSFITFAAPLGMHNMYVRISYRNECQFCLHQSC